MTETPACDPPRRDSRIVGLDLWRAILMLAGLLVHSSLMLPSRPLFVVVGDLSQAFRMGTFFAISGFLASMILLRRDAMVWLRCRIRIFRVPLLFGMLVIAPSIWALVATSRAAAYGPALFPFEWHHLWFLAGLMLYSAAAVVLHRANARLAIVARLDRLATRLPGRTAVIAVALACALPLGATMPILSWFPASIVRAFGNAQWIAAYFATFALGFLLARADRLRLRTLAARPFCAGVLVGAIAAYVATRTNATAGLFTPQIRFVMACLCPPAAFVLVLYSALAIRRVPPILRRVSDASFTIYILHSPLSDQRRPQHARAGRGRAASRLSRERRRHRDRRGRDRPCRLAPQRAVPLPRQRQAALPPPNPGRRAHSRPGCKRQSRRAKGRPKPPDSERHAQPISPLTVLQ